MCTRTQDIFFTPPPASLRPPVFQHYLLALSNVSGKEQNMVANNILLLCMYGCYLLLAESGRVGGSYE